MFHLLNSSKQELHKHNVNIIWFNREPSIGQLRKFTTQNRYPLPLYLKALVSRIMLPHIFSTDARVHAGV